MAVVVPPRRATSRIVRIGGTIRVWPRNDGSFVGSTVPDDVQDINTSINLRHGIHIGGTIPVLPRTDEEVQDQNVPGATEN